MLTQNSTQLSPAYESVLTSALFQIVVFVLLASLMLDGGFLLRMTGAIALGHLAGIVLVAFRRPTNPTAADLWLIQYGYLVMATTSFILRLTVVAYGH